MKLSFASPLLLCLCGTLGLAATTSDDSSKRPHVPCTIKSPVSGAFFDLTSVNVRLPEDGAKTSSEARNTSWPARGYDYGANFTLNICGGVVEEIDQVVGIPESRWRNVSGFYELRGKTYSIGQQNMEPVFRGRKLVLNYTQGSPCSDSSAPLRMFDREIVDDDDDDDHHRKRPGDNDRPRHNPPSSLERRKSTIISLLCASDPLAPPMALSFVGSPDSCSYFFEARTPAACGGIEVAQQQLGPGGVFSVIAIVAVLVYLVGGCVYSRTVLHQRGWRQLPNYSFWAGIGGFAKDIFVILTSTCTRCWPRRNGYSRVGSGYSDNGAGRRGRGNAEDENRLIDQLDEEWED